MEKDRELVKVLSRYTSMPEFIRLPKYDRETLDYLLGELISQGRYYVFNKLLRISNISCDHWKEIWNKYGDYLDQDYFLSPRNLGVREELEKYLSERVWYLYFEESFRHSYVVVYSNFNSIRENVFLLHEGIDTKNAKTVDIINILSRICYISRVEEGRLILFSKDHAFNHTVNNYSKPCKNFRAWRSL